MLFLGAIGSLACSADMGMPAGNDSEEDTEDSEDQSEEDLAFEIDLLTYNVAGLPEPLSASRPNVSTEQMSPLLNDYDLVLVQEDFAYHDDLAGHSEHPFQSEPMERSISNQLGDGLNRFSMSEFSGYERSAWDTCNGTVLGANDCLTPKGFTVATHQVGDVEFDVYNLHMDAGKGNGDRDARSEQSVQLALAMEEYSAGRPIILAGDTNMHEDLDEEVLAEFLEMTGAVDACQANSCPDPYRLDRVFVRGSDSVELQATSWELDERFVDEEGEPLSDHEAVAATIRFVLR